LAGEYLKENVLFPGDLPDSYENGLPSKTVSIVQVLACNLCGATSRVVLFQSGDYPDSRPGDVVQCRSCGLIYRTAWEKVTMPSESWDHFYNLSSSPDPFNKGRIRMFERYVEIISKFRKNNWVLDVGCGEGVFLKLCQDKGWNALGIEADHEVAQKARQRQGVKVMSGDFGMLSLPDNYFDVVSFFGVLDHLPDPLEALEKAYRVLRPGGAILLRQPNATFHINCRRVFAAIYKLWKGIKKFDPTTIHLFSMDQSSFRRYLQACGFREIEVKNSPPAWSGDFHSKQQMEKVLRKISQSIASIIEVTIGRYCLLAPSITVVTFKPV
jgi:ubiquinone/menaquinone biosynthesis C-methylase UbiE